MAEKKTGGFAKKIIEELFEVGATGAATAGALSLIKKLTGEVVNDPAIKKALADKLSGFVKGGRTRDDELAFDASLNLVPEDIAKAEEKQLFEQVHQSMLHPDYAGATVDERIELERRRDLAKGLIFKVAHDKTAYEEGPKQFTLVTPMWRQFFSGIKKLPDNPSKIQFLEERIMRYGENYQEGTTLKEVIPPVKSFVAKTFSAGSQGASNTAKEFFDKTFGEEAQRTANQKIQDALDRRKRR